MGAAMAKCLYLFRKLNRRLNHDCRRSGILRDRRPRSRRAATNWRATFCPHSPNTYSQLCCVGFKCHTRQANDTYGQTAKPVTVIDIGARDIIVTATLTSESIVQQAGRSFRWLRVNWCDRTELTCAI